MPFLVFFVVFVVLSLCVHGLYFTNSSVAKGEEEEVRCGPCTENAFLDLTNVALKESKSTAF